MLWNGQRKTTKKYVPTKMSIKVDYDTDFQEFKDSVDKTRNKINEYRKYIIFIKFLMFIIFIILLINKLWFWTFILWLAFLPDEVEIIRFIIKVIRYIKAYSEMNKLQKQVSEYYNNGNKEL